LNAHAPLTTQLFNTITGTTSNEYALYFGAKWLCGVVGSVYGKHCPLMLVLTGEIQNTGKTEWLRRLVPQELIHYYAESKLDAGKDDEILMTQKLIIMDDEMGGKSKKEVKRLKELTSKQTFSLREPYGRLNVELHRIAVLCGTTNDSDILADPTGNRRIIPIQVTSINQQVYNTIDKTELFYEIYKLYKAGLTWEMDKDDIVYLNSNTFEFNETCLEAELLAKYYEPGTTHWLMCSEIKIYIETKTQQKLNLRRLGQELVAKKYERKGVREGIGVRYKYGVNEINNLPQLGGFNAFTGATTNEDDTPF
jgi:predicted P-loop ATPase